MKPVINVVGATATGKSDLAIALARALDGEIINSDAMQFYRGMDIGTAKLPESERGGVVHHLIDVIDIDHEASVAEYQEWARAAILDILGRGRTPILVGGSGLYVRAATDVLSFPGTDPGIRARLEDEAAEFGLPHLVRRLGELDPPAAAKIAPTDARRVVRALEVIELTGAPFSAHLPDYTEAIPTLSIGLRTERAVLHERIARRVDLMLDAGWPAEVETLAAHGLRETRTAKAAIGYTDLLDHLDGRTTLAEARESTVVRTRQFAKRQETWFRRDPRIHWLPAEGHDIVDRALDLHRAAPERGFTGFPGYHD